MVLKSRSLAGLEKDFLMHKRIVWGTIHGDFMMASEGHGHDVRCNPILQRKYASWHILHFSIAVVFK